MNVRFIKSVFWLHILSGQYVFPEENINTELPTLNSTDIGEKVFNGKPVNPKHSRRYIAQVEGIFNGKRNIFGGLIYDKWTIITGCHNIKQATKMFAGKFYWQTSEDSQQERNVCTYSEHPKLSSEGVDRSYNYCLIHLSDPLVLNDYVKPVVFPEFDGKYPTTNCKIAGWGRVTAGHDQTHSEELREGPVTLLPSGNCMHQHATYICISAGACWYDDGGPLTCNGETKGDEVIGYISKPFPDCKTALVTALNKLPPDWLQAQLKNGSRICRGTNCCKNNGTMNGVPTIPHSRPYIVQIHSKGSKQITIGVLINAYTIVASAHKLENILKVTAGKHMFGKYEGTQQTRKPCSTSKHPKFDNPINANGYGMIHLSDPFVLNEYVNAISIAPKGYAPKDSCSIIAWQTNATETVLREQPVKFEDPKTCANKDETIACVEAGACLHDWGSPVICSLQSKIYLQAFVGSADAYCTDAMLVSIPDLPRDWLATELKKAETTCGKSTL